jgi:3-hydroxyacyl-[acyl-carrier-protein] dehydratase
MERYSQPIGPLNATQIMGFQRNRYPLLFIDTLKVAQPGKHAEAEKHFSYNEWFFPAHYDDEPVVPGFVTLEAMAQTFIMTFLTIPGLQGEKTNLVGYQGTKFLKRLVPGDKIRISATLINFSRGVAEGTVTACFESGDVVAQTEIVVSVPSVLSKYRPVDRKKS